MEYALENFQKFLLTEMTRLKGRNPAFSVRSYARKAGISHSALSEILRGKRRVSRKMVERICDRLHVDPAMREQLCSPFANRDAIKRLGNHLLERKALELKHDVFQLISKSIHYALLSLIDTEHFSDDPIWMSQRLGVSVREVSEAWALIQKLHLIEKNEKGAWIPTHESITTSDGVRDLSIQKSHLEDLERVRKSIEEVDVTHRYLTSMTMTVDPKHLPELESLIRDFRDRFAAVSEAQPKKEVYKLSLYFYPLTVLKEKPR